MFKTKKFISVLLALAMVFSVFAISATAWTGDGTQELKFDVVADKTTVNPGDTVSVECKLNLAEGGTWANTFGGFAISWMYNDAVLTPTTLVYGDIVSNFSQQRPIGKIVVATALNQVKSTSTAEEQAAWDANGYNAICKIQAVKDAATEYGSQGYWEAVDGMTLFTVTFTVNDSVAPGTAVNFDMISGLFNKNHIYLQAIDTTNGNKGTNKYGAQYYDASTASLALTVAGGETPATPVLTKTSAQVKMTPNSATTVEDAFQFRVVSKISDADWNTYFANTGVADATTNAITSVGFVAYKGTEGFSLDTAKAVAAGTAADGYSVATTDYIQYTDGADAQFGCRLEITSAETRSDVTYVAFAQYVDASGAAQVVFYDAAYEALLATNYTGIVASYLAAFPFAG